MSPTKTKESILNNSFKYLLHNNFEKVVPLSVPDKIEMNELCHYPIFLLYVKPLSVIK